MNQQLHKLAELVRQMRKAQNHCDAIALEFPSLDAALSAKWEFERRVDAMVSNILDSQGRLWDEKAQESTIP